MPGQNEKYLLIKDNEKERFAFYPFDAKDSEAVSNMNGIENRALDKGFLTEHIEKEKFDRIADFLKTVKKYKEMDVKSLLGASGPRIEYTGKLPQYAQQADRAYVVQIHCRQGCRCVRWAELNKPFPGRDELRQAAHGEYIAICLKCGSEVKDHINWKR
jgi:hypothetical protein